VNETQRLLDEAVASGVFVSDDDGVNHTGCSAMSPSGVPVSRCRRISASILSATVRGMPNACR
jgi:hypothetical protein